jgi:hypothetical protein
MKKQIFSLAILFALSQSVSSARSLTLAATQNITCNAGQTVPVTFTALGWSAGQTAEIWLVNAKTWEGEVVAIDVPVASGKQTYSLTIPWSWWETGCYVPRVVIGGYGVTGSGGSIRIRSAIIWPYGGSTFTHRSNLYVTWTTSTYIAADYLVVHVYNEDTGESALVGDQVDPEAGRFGFALPEVAGRYRIVLDGYLLIDMTDGSDEEIFPDLSATAESEVIRVQ